jgi:hypothetical protein
VDCEQVVLFCPGGDPGRLERLAEVATLVKEAASADVGSAMPTGA